MRKNKAGKNKKTEKEYKKKSFFAMDDEYDDEEYDDDEDDDEEDEDDEDYDDEEIEDEDDDEYDDDEEDDDDEYEDDDDEEDDDDDDDDDEEDDDEIDDDGEDENSREWGNEGARRARRRARRIRNQILAYMVIVILTAGVLGGCFIGGRKIVQKFQSDKQQEKELQERLKALEETEQEPVVNLDETEEEENQAVIDPLDEIVTAKITEMPLEDKVAALFMVTPGQLTGVPTVTKAGETTKEALTKYKVGGLVYTDSNITKADQLKELLSNTALIDQTLFLAVAEEGGENSVVASKLSVTEVPDMASIENAEAAYQAGSDTGTYLAEYGFNLNLAPVADVKISEDSILGNRSFGSDAGQVGEMAASYVRGLTEKGVSACVKTFPGQGSVTKSTAEGMADSQRSQSEMEATEFPAYQSAISAGSEFVMVGTISVPGLTGDNTPCCLSAAAVGLLRNNLGFDGIIITDALNETAITDYYTSAEAAEKALKAGVDMIYMPENFEEAYTGLLEAVENGTLEESRIDESLLRIYRVKYKNKVDSMFAAEGDGAEEAPEAEGGEEIPAE